MARRRVLLTLVLFVVFFSKTLALHGDELQLLLSFKASISDPFHFLSNWSSSANSNFCNWPGITCNNSSRVNAVHLSGKNISGKITASIFRLPDIETIDLSNNQIVGEIPDGVFYGSSLRYLNLSNNNLTGSLPSGSISILEKLDLCNNMLSGRIPEDIGAFSSLKYLDLGGNVLTGEIPVSVSNLSRLESFTLASNQLVGEIPSDLGKMTSLKWIYLGYNNLSGEIPASIGELKSLNHLDLVYNNLTGEIPASIGNLIQLKYLFLYKNQLTGPIPRSVFGLKNLISLDVSDNFLSGEIPELVIQFQELEILHLFANNFTGKIPIALASLPKLQVLQLWSNNLSGEIPEDLGKRNNLTIIDLSSNSLDGKIPEGLCNSDRLFKLILFSNSLHGEIPKSLNNCKSLIRVRLQNNQLSGELSTGFTKLPLINFLDVSSNNLSGRIDDRRWEMPSLQMLKLSRNGLHGLLPESFGSDNLENLDLSENQFAGNVPHSFGNFTKLVQLDLSHNKFSGEIPNELSSCQRLVNLDLSDNKFTGEIPASLAEMPVLGQLDLSENQFSGEIPRNLGSVESLVQVNVSHNHFQGTLPSTVAFLAINASAVAGNDLCGGEIVTGLPPCRKSFNSNRTWWLILTCFLGALAGFVIAASLFVFIRRRKDLELKRVENEDGIWEIQFFESKFSKSITIDDVVSSARNGNSISLGSKGISYKGKSSINGIEFVVKEINYANSIPESVWSEMLEFGKLRHPNIVKLIGICRSQKCGYLVYEYCDGKVLSEILRNLSWERRRKIATGIAKALRFLQCCCSPSVVVGHLSPEEVIVDGKDEARLSLTPPGLVYSGSKGFSSSAYSAPEAGKEPTEKSDIYSFGLVLIELLTGKSPADAEFGVRESFVEWARYCYSDCHLDAWIDPIIRGHVMNNQQNEIVETMNLALHCTAGDPTARPRANDICKSLDSVRRTTSSCVENLKNVSSPL
ncbi:hypothetical protein UlMin_034867 [Ulmus minor]